jgi:hypothetical protein
MTPTTAIREHQMIYKVGYVEPEPSEFRFQNVYARETRRDVPLLCLGPNGGHVELLKKLLERMPEPMWILYVLVVPRGEGEAGRYQSANSFLRNDIGGFLDRFRNYFESDARHHIWLKSEQGPALLVLDSHGLIYCYGPVESWANDLDELGWREVEAGTILLPNPHQHHYHEIFDDDAKNVLSSMEWIHSPLRDEDQ